MKRTGKLKSRSLLYSFRKKWGMSQAALAQQVLLSRSMVGMIELGKRQLPNMVLLQIARLELALTTQTGNGADDSGSPEAKRLRQHCLQLQVKEAHSYIKAKLLSGELEKLRAMHRRACSLLQLAAMHLAGACSNSFVLAYWKKQKEKASRMLQGCGEPVQQQMRYHIAIAAEAAALYQKQQAQLKQELAAETNRGG